MIGTQRTCQLSDNDRMLLAAFEHQNIQLAEFNHALHIKLAYGYLTQFGLAESEKKISSGLIQFLETKGVNKNKFHQTMTTAWLKAVWHFMQSEETCSSSEVFIENNPNLLNKDLLDSHYSRSLLFSDRARKKYIKPDLHPFPEG